MIARLSPSACRLGCGPGEIRRESYSNHFANVLEGIDLDRPGTIRSRAGTAAPVPRVTGPIVRREPVHVADLDFLRSQTDRPVKVTVPGPFTMSQQAQNDFYEDEEALALAYADVVREELDDLFAAGADVVQLDEPWMEARPEAARRLALPALERALDGARGTTAMAAPDCGMKYLSRDVAFAKLQAMVAGARQAAGEAQRRPAG